MGRGRVLYFETRPVQFCAVRTGLNSGCCPETGVSLSNQGGFIADRNFRQADRTRVNERIRAREVRVIDEEGGQLGVMQPFEAVRMARERGLDLVEISPTADPPVCKITDYGKFLYQQNKKAHEQRKSSRGSQLKEVKFRPATAEHDYQVRKNQIIRFLGEGHKVRAMIFHRGREMAHQEVGRAKMTRLLGEIGEHGAIETMPRMEGNVLVALLAPKKGAGVPSKPAPQQANAAN
jgi:translation initiation factor IF-3